MAHGMEVGLDPGHIVLDGDSAPLPKRRQMPPIFVPFLLCQRAGCIKMPFGMEVGLGPGHIVLDEDPAIPPPKKEHIPPIFGPCPLWPYSWMD